MKAAIEILSYQIKQIQEDLERQKFLKGEADDSIAAANNEIKRLRERKCELEAAVAKLELSTE